MIVTSVIFVCYWFMHPQPFTRKFLQHPLVLVFAAGLCWTAVTVIFSTEPLLSVKFLIARTWYIGAFLLAPLMLFRDAEHIRRSAIVLSTSLVIITVIALVRHSFNGFSFATINEAVNPFFRNHVNYSAMLAVILPVLIAFYLYASPLWKKRIAVAIALVTLALIFSYARGAWLAVIAGAIAFYALRRKWLLTLYLFALLLVTGAVCWLREDDRYLQYAHDYKSTIFHEDFGQHILATYHGKDVSTAERFYRWIAGVRMLKDKPLTGFGPTSFYENYKPYTIRVFRTWVSRNPERSTVHNYFLLLAIEQGIPGLMFFVILTAVMFGYAQKIWQRNASRFSRVVAAVTAVMLTELIVVNFLSDMIETDKVGSLFLLCLAALIATDVHSRAASDPSPDVERVP
jgi:O-antigen ligase